ncbi:ABC transporter ATP-binding protein [Marivivens aquimaris]|uniref:ABC transporter ATP-binding protein n=1 Tax=Marivivens aquimaris TaxID=2774876 RepID=UPI00187F0C14|nr:sn-glycerol-3-phosphate ABC transporter ATP-binding protein UgpC [Marivivens aquimaris]
MSGVSLRDLRKSYGALDVIHGASLDIKEGEFVVFVGPSGCGKSTMLRMIAGLEEISGGTVSIGGKEMNAVPARDRGVAMVFQNYALYPHMSVRDNMGFGLKNMGFAKKDIAERVNNAAEILQLTPYLDRKPKALSGGQRQRVAIGRAIVREPDVFLFDEPLSNLDAALRVQTRTEISQLHARLGATMIYVTHDQTEALTMADRIVVLRDGVIEQVGAPLELYDRPANLFVAGFIGAPKMNFLSAVLQQVAPNGAATAKIESGEVIPVQVSSAHAQSGDKVTLGLRPENIAVDPAGPLKGKVDLVEQLGNVELIYATLDMGCKIVAELRTRISPQMGDRIAFRSLSETIHVFNSNGEAITAHNVLKVAS